MSKKKADRNSPEYWEKVLKRHGLGVEDKGSAVQTDHSNEKVTDQLTFQSGDDFDKLRQQFDGSDNFMEGHQIQKVRKNTGQQVTPDWVYDDVKLRLLLLSTFPKLTTDTKQRTRASRWLRAIHLYYRMGLSRPAVAKELGMPETALISLLRNILRVSQGRRANGTGLKTVPPPKPACENPEGTGREENAGD